MAGKRKKQKERQKLYESPEKIYELAVERMRVDSMLCHHPYKEENLLTAATMFEGLGDMKDAPRLRIECETLAADAARERKDHRLEQIRSRIRSGQEKQESDYRRYLDQLEELGELGDAEKLREECRRALYRIKHKRKVKRRIVWGVILLFALAVFAGFQTQFFRYCVAFAYEKSRDLEKASQIYASIPDVLDSSQRSVRLAREDRLRTDRNGLAKLKSAEPGEKVEFAGQSWALLEREGNEALCILAGMPMEALLNLPFCEDGGKADYDHSSLRERILAVCDETFHDRERSRLLPVDESGDQMTILTEAQAEKYETALEELKKVNYWVNAPGESGDGTAMYVTPGGNLIRYGINTDSEAICARPVIRVRLSKEDREEQEVAIE